MSEALSGAPNRVLDESALRAIVEGTAAMTGEDFYRALVRNLACGLDVTGAWVTELDIERMHMRTLAVWYDGAWRDNFDYSIVGTPCETTVVENRMVHVEDRIAELYPHDSTIDLTPGAVSYLGVPMLGTDNRVLGHVAVVDRRPMPPDERLLTLFRIFASRAVAEMRRLRLEAELRERQERLSRLIGSAMDAIVEFDGDLRITLVNSAAEKLFAAPSDWVCGQRLDRLVGPAAMQKLDGLRRELEGRGDGDGEGAGPADAAHCLWIPGGLNARPPGLRPFPAEASLSHFRMKGKPFYTLILRNVDERLEAERRIRSLSAEAEYLRSEIETDHGFDEIHGRSPALRVALQAVEQVAATNATVLLLGETGTGKELFARALHNRSPRRGHPLIKVNCAAIPSALIESEFFGHEKGAFTGATQRREGRFALADGGTIFLDEIGELPLELQGKLLRVLQEGEFEPVGGARTRRVDVRVLAATNRDLEREVQEGRFREDLYYRLSVFPIRLPPLRSRADDVVHIAVALVEKLARGLGRATRPLSASDVAALRSYAWPGNVRELRNVIERAIITSPDGHLRLERVLGAAAAPHGAAGPAPPAAVGPPAPGPGVTGAILTEDELRGLERANTIAALERASWKVGGAGGAAALLGVSPSTLKSRMRALAIERPAGSAAD